MSTHDELSNDQTGDLSDIECLIRRLRAHAEANEYIANADHEQKQWMHDLYDAADALERSTLWQPKAKIAQSPAGYGWQSISTAPHADHVLLVSPPDDTRGWKYEVGQASWGWPRKSNGRRWHGMGTEVLSHHGTATHWMPLPSPPNAEVNTHDDPQITTGAPNEHER